MARSGRSKKTPPQPTAAAAAAARSYLRCPLGPFLSPPVASPIDGGGGSIHPLHRSNLLVFFKSWFSSDIGEVVATMMTCWNKVFLAFLYLDDVRSDAVEGHVGISSARSESSLQIFVDTVDCLLLWRLRPLLSIRSTTRSDFFNPLFWWEGLQVCITWSAPPVDVLLAVARSCCC